MKKILCFMLILFFVILSVLTVSAENSKNSTMYKDEVFALLGWKDDGVKTDYRSIYAYNADGSVADTDKADYMLGFAHRYDNPNGLLHTGEAEMYGNYWVDYSEYYVPGYFIYSADENKMYSIRDAWTEKLPNIEAVLEIVGSKVCLFADVFEKYLESCGERYEKYNASWYYIEELYYYDSSKGGIIGGTNKLPQATPDYALVKVSARYGVPTYNVLGVYGGYVVSSSYGRPEPLQYYIYTPEDGKIYTLREAYNSGVENIDKVFTDYSLGKLIGDLDYDKKITIKDATYIQKYIVGFTDFPRPRNENGVYESLSEHSDWVANVADFDFSNKIDIKDATAIQKHIAGIETGYLIGKQKAK